MRWVAKSLAVLSVLSWIVVASIFARPVATPTDSEPSRRASRAAARALPSDWSSRVLRDARSIFPGVDVDAIPGAAALAERHGKRFGVDPLTILAVIHVESRFDPQAVSSKGAMGLMQIQPETGRALAEDLGLQWTGDELLYEPEINVLLGTFYLRRLIDRFGDVDAALAAYCSGPTLVESLQLEDGKIPLRYSDRVWDVLTALHARTQA